MKKSIVLTALLFTTLMSTSVYAQNFSDINNSEYSEEITYFNSQGFYKNLFVNDDSFYPEKEITRGEFTVIFMNTFNIAPIEKIDTPFKDIDKVPTNIKPYVYSSYDNDVVAGKPYNDGLYFKSNDHITKEEAITIIGRYFNLVSHVEIQFKDADSVSPWAKEYVSYFYNNDLFNLSEDGYFNPKEPLTREEATKIICDVKDYLNAQKDNGYVVKNYIGSSAFGFKNDSYEKSTFSIVSDIIEDNGDFVISDTSSNQIRRASNGKVNVDAGIHKEFNSIGLPIGDYVDGNINKAVLDNPTNLLKLDDENILFTEFNHNFIRGYNKTTQEVYTLTGSKSKAGYINGSLDVALYNSPMGLAKDSKGNIYVADTFNHVIRKIDTLGNVTLFTGSPNQYGNKTGTLETAMFNEPTNIFITAYDVIYVTDSGNNMIKKIDNGEVSVVAGVETTFNEETQTFVGSDRDGDISIAKFNYPMGIYVDGNLVYVADTENNKIKVIDTTTNMVKTIAGNGHYDNAIGNALQASFSRPTDLIIDNGNILVADSNNNVIKVIEKK